MNVNPIDRMLEFLSSESKGKVQLIDSGKMRQDVAHINITKAKVSVEEDKNISFSLTCDAIITSRIELGVIGELSLMLRDSEIVNEEGETQKIIPIAKTENISLLGGGKIEVSLPFMYYLETPYNEAANKLNQIDWSDSNE